MKMLLKMMVGWVSCHRVPRLIKIWYHCTDRQTAQWGRVESARHILICGDLVQDRDSVGIAWATQDMVFFPFHSKKNNVRCLLPT